MPHSDQPPHSGEASDCHSQGIKLQSQVTHSRSATPGATVEQVGVAHCVRHSPAAGRVSAWVGTLLLKNIEYVCVRPHEAMRKEW